MCSASPGRWMNWDDKPLSNNHRGVSVASATNLKRLEEVFARRVFLVLISHRVVREVGEPIIRLVSMIKQYPATLVRDLAGAIRSMRKIRCYPRNKRPFHLRGDRRPSRGRCWVVWNAIASGPRVRLGHNLSDEHPASRKLNLTWANERREIPSLLHAVVVDQLAIGGSGTTSRWSPASRPS